jgi:hypothetical protein
MNTNIHEICDSFNDYLQINEVKRDQIKHESAHEMEQKIIQKHLNGHLQNQAFHPPAYFSPKPVINNSLGRTSDIYKLFTNRNNKFSGNPKENLSLLEFINSMNSAQAQAKLSEKEFKDMLLACTTGEAHRFLVDWMENSNEDVSSTYHQLSLRFDNRTDPETARVQLFNYTATKDKTLAQVESEIMSLSYRSSAIYPPGESRTMAQNFEFCNTLMRCLPTKSSELVRKAHGEISTLIHRSPTSTELSRSLHNLRHIINKDIESNGADPYIKETPTRPEFIKRNPDLKPFGNYAAYNNEEEFDTPPSEDNSNVYTHNESHTPTNGTRPHPMGEHNTANQPFKNWPNRSDSRNGSWHNQSIRSRRPNNKKVLPSCSLCGETDHSTDSDCPNMVTDSGMHIKLHPTQGTCDLCPGNKRNTLHHPSTLCPWRSPNGIFRNQDPKMDR